MKPTDAKPTVNAAGPDVGITPASELGFPLRLLRRILPWAMLFVLAAGIGGGLRLAVALNQPFAGVALSWRKEIRLYTVSNVTPANWPGVLAGLQINDRILCVDGFRPRPQAQLFGVGQRFQNLDCPKGHRDYFQVLQEEWQKGDATLDFLVEREEKLVEAGGIPLLLVTPNYLLEAFLPSFLSGMGLLIIGYAVFRAQATKEINLVFALFATVAAALMMEHNYATILGSWFEDTWWVTLFLMVPTLPLLGASLFHLTNLMMEQGRMQRWGRRLLAPFYLLAAGFIGLGVAIYLLHDSPISAPYDPYFLEWILYSALFAMVWSVVGLVWTFWRSPSRRLRRQAGVVLLGIAATLSFVISYIMYFLTAASGPSFINSVPYVALVFVAAMAYAILRYQTFVARERILTALLVTILCIVVANVVYLAAGQAVGFLPILAAALLVGVTLELRRGPTAFLNRLLRREMLDYQTVARFSQAVGGLQGSEALVATAQGLFCSNLDAEWADVWLLEEEQQVVEAYREGQRLHTEPLPTGLAAALAARPEPSHAAGEGSGLAALLPGSEGRRVALWAPLVERSQAVGVVGLGPRWTGEVYADEDRQLAGILARQMALAILNTRQWERLQATARLVWQAEENERRKIARELHDTILQFLLVLTYGLDDLKEPRTAPPGEIERWQDRISAEADQLRAPLNHLRAPELLVKDGLAPSLGRWLAQVGGETGLALEVDLAAEVEPLLATEAKVALYRTCREAVRNALKHSGGSRVVVRLAREGDQAVLTVADDGQGFDAVQAWHGGAKGYSSLQDMHLYMESVGGGLELRAEVGGGTVVRGWAPVVKGN